MFAHRQLHPASLENLRSGPPVLTLPSLIGQRREAVEARGAPASLADGRPHPVNPVLLASAMSCSAVLGFDYGSFLTDYMRGEDLPELEEALLPGPVIEGEQDLISFIKLESKYLEGVRLLMLAMTPMFVESEVFRSRFEAEADPTDLLQNLWDRIAAGDLPPGADFDKYDLLLRSWLMINPTLLRHSASTVLLLEYGHRYNEDIHEERERWERRLRVIDAEMNEILAASITPEHKRRAILAWGPQREIATGMLRRARRLYQWNPAEIQAHQQGDKAEQLFVERYGRGTWGEGWGGEGSSEELRRAEELRAEESRHYGE